MFSFTLAEPWAATGLFETKSSQLRNSTAKSLRAPRRGKDLGEIFASLRLCGDKSTFQRRHSKIPSFRSAGRPPAGKLCLFISLWFSFTLAFVSPDSVQAESGGHHILVLGDSLAAGYGVSPEEAFPALLAEKMKKQGLQGKVINGGVSGETTAGGLRRISWLLENPIDILILELGANDGLRGIPLEETEGNLRQIIQTAKNRYPDIKIVLAGMKIPPNMGPTYTRRFEEVYEKLSREESTLLVPFLLEGVAGRPELNLPDGIHPTARGHRIVAQTVWKVLEPLLESR